MIKHIAKWIRYKWIRQIETDFAVHNSPKKISPVHTVQYTQETQFTAQFSEPLCTGMS